MLKENLKEIRKALGLSVAKFAQRLEMPAPTITCYERGERTPSAQLFINLHIKLNVNLNWFVTGNGNMFFINSSNSQPDILQLKNYVMQILKDEGITTRSNQLPDLN